MNSTKNPGRFAGAAPYGFQGAVFLFSLFKFLVSNFYFSCMAGGAFISPVGSLLNSFL